MKQISIAIAALALATSSTAFAGQDVRQPSKQEVKPQPVKMTDAQMDKVAGGQALIEVVLIDVVDVERNEIVKNVQVNIPVAASAAIGVLGGAVSGPVFQRPGRNVINN